MERDRQALWRTGVQLVCGVGMALGVAFMWLEDTILFEFLPDASDATRVGAMIAAVALVVVCSSAYWRSLRRLRADSPE